MSDPEVIVWYTPKEVAAKFRVDPKTLTRWEKSGKLKEFNIRWMVTPGKHRRYCKEDVDRVLREML